MSKSIDRLYELLPAVYRLRDAEQGYPLQALLRVIAEQINLVEDDIAQLYENWFIETCQDWVVPYIGDLIGYRPVHEAGEPGDQKTRRARQRNKILIPRREVANTIRYRRRKGALALLELLANAVAGWPARAVEFYRLLGWTQHLNHLHQSRGRTIDLRNGKALAHLDGPFDQTGHTVEVRRVVSNHDLGRYNIPSVGVFVWRLKSYSVTQTPAYCFEKVGRHRYTFSVLGNDVPLYNNPRPEKEPTDIAGEVNLPTPIRRRALEKRIMINGRVVRTQASDLYYGDGKSLTIWVAGLPIPKERILPADLSNWKYRPAPNFVAVDPELGRIAFRSDQKEAAVTVSYHYAFSADLGGGEYQRTLSQLPGSKLYLVGSTGHFLTITEALDAWQNEQVKPQSAVIEITDSGVYTEQLAISLEQSETLQIRAANRTRPVIRLQDPTMGPDPFRIRGAAGSRLILDGLLITGRNLLVDGTGETEDCPEAQKSSDLCALVIRHCTLVPGWTLHGDCLPRYPAEPSLELDNTSAKVSIEHSIVGSIQVTADEVKKEPVYIRITDSILDATGHECETPDCEALGASDLPLAYAVLNMARSTVIGKVNTHAIELAENCIFQGSVMVARRQLGCLRFCYVPPGSRTPRRYHCQPDLVEQAVRKLAKTAEQKGAIEADIEMERLRVKPQFNSMRYGAPTYCQLADSCADEIKRGADDESEVGVFHDLYQPQRAANLRARLDEYTPAGLDAGLILAD